MNIPQNSYHCSISSVVIDRLGGTLSDLLELPALLWRGSKHDGEVHLHEPLINRSKQKISNPLAWTKLTHTPALHLFCSSIASTRSFAAFTTLKEHLADGLKFKNWPLYSLHHNLFSFFTNTKLCDCIVTLWGFLEIDRTGYTLEIYYFKGERGDKPILLHMNPFCFRQRWADYITIKEKLKASAFNITDGLSFIITTEPLGLLVYEGIKAEA